MTFTQEYAKLLYTLYNQREDDDDDEDEDEEFDDEDEAEDDEILILQWRHGNIKTLRYGGVENGEVERLRVECCKIK